MRSGGGVEVGVTDLEVVPPKSEWIDLYVGGSIDVDCRGRKG